MAIAQEGHVLTVKPTMTAMIEHEGRPPPRRIGVGKASVFPGFCSKHDSELFKAIEGNDIELASKAASLFAFRAIAYESFHKTKQLAVYDIEALMDSGLPFELQATAQQIIHATRWGTRRGVADAERWKVEHDAAVSDGGAGLHHLMLRFDHLLPIVACGAFHVETDLDGRLLQRPARGDVRFDHMTFVVTAYEGRSVAILAWTGTPTGPAGRLARSLWRRSDDQKADAVVRLGFERLDNIFIRPGWWDGLDNRARAAVTSMIYNQPSLFDGDAIPTAPDPRSFSDAVVVEVSASGQP